MVLLVFDMIGPYIMFAYSETGRMMTLNVETIGSFYLLILVKVSAPNMLRVCFALVMVIICWKNFNFWSRVFWGEF